MWDKGLYSSFLKDREGNDISISESLEKGFMLLWLAGHKLKGGYLLVRISKKQRWLLIKIDDEYASRGGKMPSNWNSSVKSGKTL